MTEREFCYWLQGLFEIGGVTSLDEQQTQIVKDHLALVFKKVTPDRKPMDTPKTPAVPMPGLPYEMLREPIHPMDPYRWVMPPRVTCATDASDKSKNLIAIC